MKTVTVENLLKSGIATLNDPTQKKVYILKFMVYLNQSCHRHYGLVGYGRLVNIPDVFVIDDEFDVVTEAHPGAIVQDVASRAADIDEYIDMFRRRGVHIPDNTHHHTQVS
jgi:hypothetical protein